MKTPKMQRLEDLSKLTGTSLIFPASHDEVARMATQLLAFIEASENPIAWTDAEELRDVKNNGSGYLFSIGGEANKFSDPTRQIMLFTAPPEAKIKPVAFIDGDVSESAAKELAEILKNWDSSPEVIGENELLPCPFCGGEAKQTTIEKDDDPCFGGDVITCTGCGASSHVEFGHKENLKSAWNSRAKKGDK